MDGLSAAASVVAIIQVVAAIPPVVNSVRAFFNIKEDLAELLNQLETLDVEAEWIKETIQEYLEGGNLAGEAIPEPISLKRARTALHNILTELKKLANDCQSQPRPGKPLRPRRSRWLWNSKKIEDLLARTGECRSQIQMALSLVTWRKLNHQGKMIQEIHTMTVVHPQSVKGSVNVQRLLPQGLASGIGNEGVGAAVARCTSRSRHAYSLQGRRSSLDASTSKPTLVQYFPDQLDKAPETSVPAEEMICIETSLFKSQRCHPYCRCQCHFRRTRTHYESPRWVRPLLGSFFLHYDSLPILQNESKCDQPNCYRTSSKVRFHYFFPGWLLKRAVVLSASVGSLFSEGASLHLAVPRIIANDDEVWWSIQYGETVRFQRLFVNMRYRPVDIHSDGKTLLLMALDWERYDIVELLVAEWGLKRNRQSSDRRAIILARDHLLVDGDQLNEQHRQALETVAALDDTDEELAPVARQAVLQGTNALEKVLASDRAGVNDTDSGDRTALHYACLLGNLHAVDLLIGAGASLDARDCEGETALTVALLYRRWDCARALVDAGCDAAVQDNFGNNALFYALIEDVTKSVEMLRHLVRARPGLVTARGASGRTALHWLADVRGPPDLAEEVLQIFLSGGAALEARDDFGCTPLLWAVRNDNALAVQLLLQAGANPDAPPDSYGYNLLHFTALFGRLNVLHALTDANVTGVDVDVVDDGEFTPLDCWRWRRYKNEDFLLAGMSRPTAEENTAFEALLHGIRDRTFRADIVLCESIMEAAKDQDFAKARDLMKPFMERGVRNHTYRGCAGLMTNILLQIRGGMWDTALTELEGIVESRRDRLGISPFKEESNYWYPDPEDGSEFEDEDVSDESEAEEDGNQYSSEEKSGHAGEENGGTAEHILGSLMVEEVETLDGEVCEAGVGEHEGGQTRQTKPA